MQRNIVAGKIGYKITIEDRGILSVVCSIYDPLGFASPFALRPRPFCKIFVEAGWDGFRMG